MSFKNREERYQAALKSGYTQERAKLIADKWEKRQQREQKQDEFKKKIVHALVCTPAYDGKVDCDYSQSLAEACQAATVYGIRVTACVMGNGAFIELARNVFVRMFLEEHPECTHLFFIDSDLKFEPRAFVSLLKSGKPVVAGAYRRRQENEDYPVVWATRPDSPTIEGRKLMWIEDGWIQCERVPTGFLCIERSVLEQMWDVTRKIKIYGQPETAELFYTFVNDEGRFVGEDFAWCDDYRKQFGRMIEVWPDFDFVHAGYPCNFAKWLNLESEEKGRRIGDRRKKSA